MLPPAEPCPIYTPLPVSSPVLTLRESIDIKLCFMIRAANDPSVLSITAKAPTRAFSWLKAPTSTFTFKTLLRHSAKRALTPTPV